MDPISQGAVGAALAASVAGRRAVLRGAALGAAAGMAPDLDVLIQSPSDPLLFLEYHRQFTHALAFVPLGALLCAAVLHGFVRRSQGFRATYGFCFIGFASHGLLDACTSYGTRLLWPFSELRVAWNVVSVVDPLFTLPLLVLLVTALLRRRPALAQLGLAWMAVYLLLGATQHLRARDAALELAAQRGAAVERLTVKPSFGNLLLWKSIYLADGWYHVDALRLGLAVTVVPGERVRQFALPRAFPHLPAGSRVARDIERFRRFSDDHLAQDPADRQRVIDVRYSMLPHKIDPLWGIRVDPAAPDQPASFYTQRQTSERERQMLWRLLRGELDRLREGA